MTDQTRDAQQRRFRPYPEYRDSGIEWLGRVPGHWDVKPVKAALVCNDSGVWGEDFDDDGTIVLRSTEQTVQGLWRIEAPARRRLTAREASDTRLYVGDLLVTKSSGSAHHIGKTSIVDESIAALNCCYSNFMQRLRVSARHAPKFFWYFMNCPVAREQLVFLSSTTTGLGNLNGSILGAIRVPVGPRDEQCAIADFLDRETAKIDGLVARKQRLIELFQEKRTALITRAVTRGLDPNVPMKDSGVEWLGQVPAHWDARPLKSVAALQTGLTLGKRYEGEAMTTCPYLRVANVQDGYLALDDIAEVEVPVHDVERFQLRMGDVLVTEGGDFDKLGRGYVWKEQLAQCLHQNHIFAVRPRRGALTSHFLALVMSSTYGRAYFTATSKQSTNLASTNSTTLRNLPIPLPGINEQGEITHWAELLSTNVDALVTKVRKAIDHLGEFRAALISAAVTGKIDVRQAASR